MQHITFAHWLPSILGEEGMRAQVGPYRGYNASEVVTAMSEFDHILQFQTTDFPGY